MSQDDRLTIRLNELKNKYENELTRVADIKKQINAHSNPPQDLLDALKEAERNAKNFGKQCKMLQFRKVIN